jgi:hypothetical protein
LHLTRIDGNLFPQPVRGNDVSSTAVKISVEAMKPSETVCRGFTTVFVRLRVREDRPSPPNNVELDHVIRITRRQCHWAQGHKD